MEEESLEDECARRIRQSRNICETRQLCPWQPDNGQSLNKPCPLCELKDNNNQMAASREYSSSIEKPNSNTGGSTNGNTASSTPDELRKNSSSSPQKCSKCNGQKSSSQNG